MPGGIGALQLAIADYPTGPGVTTSYDAHGRRTSVTEATRLRRGWPPGSGVASRHLVLDLRQHLLPCLDRGQPGR